MGTEHTQMISTRDIIATTLRQLEAQHVFMPGALDRITQRLDKDHYTPSWVDEAERAINNEKLTLKKLEAMGVTIQVLVGWQAWMLWRDEIP
jgi:hypothetical protein